MVALLHHPPAVDDQDQICRQDGAQAVSDDDARPLTHDALQRLLNERFRFAVQAAGGFVQNQDTRVFEDDPRDGQALFFATAEPVSALSHHGIVPIRQFAHKIMNIGRHTGFFQFSLRGIRPGVKQVGADGVMKEIGFLGHHANLAGERFQGYIAQIGAIQGDAPAGGVIQPGDQVGERGFPRAAWAHQRHQLPGFHVKADVFKSVTPGLRTPFFRLKFRLSVTQGGHDAVHAAIAVHIAQDDAIARLVGEGDVFKGDLSLHFCERYGIGLFADFNGLIEHLKHPFKTDEGRSKIHRRVNQRLHRTVQAQHERAERHNCADGENPADNEITA